LPLRARQSPGRSHLHSGDPCQPPPVFQLRPTLSFRA
jgi:hypothetical protein